MAGIFGTLNLNDSDRVYQATAGQALIYQAIQEYLARVNADLLAQTSVLVSGTTDNYKERYKLPGGGRLQKMGFAPQGKPAAVKAIGGWDVAYPLEEYAAQIAGDRVSMAYMTIGDLDRHISTVVIQDVNTVRFEMLKALFNSTAGTFVDPLWGSLTIQRLANGDAVVYPPVIGSESEATDNHYLESGYAAADISDTNNPFVTINNELEEHFGMMAGGPNIATFFNSSHSTVVEDLTDFVESGDRFVTPGTQTATLSPLGRAHPGRLIGRTNGNWCIEWDWIPANYFVGIYLDTDAPLKMRVDPGDTGLGVGLQLVAEDYDHPFESSFWSHRFGFGVGNRLAAVVVEMGTGGTYTVPAAYQ